MTTTLILLYAVDDTWSEVCRRNVLGFGGRSRRVLKNLPLKCTVVGSHSIPNILFKYLCQGPNIIDPHYKAKLNDMGLC